MAACDQNSVGVGRDTLIGSGYPQDPGVPSASEAQTFHRPLYIWRVCTPEICPELVFTPEQTL